MPEVPRERPPTETTYLSTLIRSKCPTCKLEIAFSGLSAHIAGCSKPPPATTSHSSSSHTSTNSSTRSFGQESPSLYQSDVINLDLDLELEAARSQSTANPEVNSRDKSTNSQPTNAPQVSNSIQQSQLLEMFPNIAADVVEAALLEEDPVEFLLTYESLGVVNEMTDDASLEVIRMDYQRNFLVEGDLPLHVDNAEKRFSEAKAWYKRSYNLPERLRRKLVIHFKNVSTAVCNFKPQPLGHMGNIGSLLLGVSSPSYFSTVRRSS